MLKSDIQKVNTAAAAITEAKKDISLVTAAEVAAERMQKEYLANKR